MSVAWGFFQNQMLSIHWLNSLVGRMLTTFGMDIEKRVGASLKFFLYDTIKIFVLLSFLIFIISYIQSFFPPQRTRKLLGRYKGIKANILSALLGTVTPFCSCSSILLFMDFTSAGLSLGISFSFLISSPLVDLGSLVLITSIFGPNTAIAYVLDGLVLAVLGGSNIERMHMEGDVEPFIMNIQSVEGEEEVLSIKARLSYAWTQVRSTVQKVFWYVI